MLFGEGEGKFLPHLEDRFLAFSDQFPFLGHGRHQDGHGNVESQWHVTMLASWAILPQLCASSNVQPESPPQCGASVTTCRAYLWPPGPCRMKVAVTSLCWTKFLGVPPPK